MTESSVQRAACASCGTVFRVPSAERTYQCKKCGGIVRATLEAAVVEPVQDAEEPATCATCSAVLPRNTRYCPECGTDSHARPAALHAPTATERKLAARDLTEARRAVDFVRNVFWLEAAVFGFLALAPLFALVDPTIPLKEVLGQVALPLALFVLSAVAVGQVALHPFAWSLGIATFWSVNLVAALVQGSRLPALLPLLITAGLWLSVLPTIRVRRLVRRHPGAYGARALLGVVAGRDIDADELQRLAVRAAWKRSGIYAASALGIVALAAAGAWTMLRPRPLSSALDAFVRAWNRSDVGEVMGFFERGRSGEQRVRLERVRTSRQWDTLPALAQPPEPRLVGGDMAGKVSVKLSLPFDELDQELVLTWAREGNGWILEDLELPQPPMDDALRAFTTAWNGADPDALASLFRESSRARFRAYFERLVEKRGWSTGYPEVLSNQVLSLGGDAADVWHRTPSGRFRTRWTVQADDSWALLTLEPPE